MQIDTGTIAAVTPLYALIGSLGSAAAACFVVYIFMGFLRETAKRREELFERLTKDNAHILSQVIVSLDNNTRALERIEATARVLNDRFDARPKGST